MPRELITDGELHDTTAFAQNARTYRAMPGIVEAYYPGEPGVSPPSVDVQPAVHDVRFAVENDVPTPGILEGQRYSEPWHILPKVPVQFPTMGGFAMWGPMKKGDRVMLVSFDLDPSTYLATGQEADPPMTRRNGGAHWWAIPGDFTDPGALPDPGQAICFGTPGGVMVTVDATAVNVGAAAPTDKAARASVVDAVLQALMAALQTASSSPAPIGPFASALLSAIEGAGYQPTTGTVASKTVKIAP